MPENQPIEPLEPMNNNPSGKSRSIALFAIVWCAVTAAHGLPVAKYHAFRLNLLVMNVEANHHYTISPSQTDKIREILPQVRQKPVKRNRNDYPEPLYERYVLEGRDSSGRWVGVFEIGADGSLGSVYFIDESPSSVRRYFKWLVSKYGATPAELMRF